VRERNQELIKPFIQSNPFGAGVGSIGAWGRRFTPDSELANFAPDSSYVRVAVELGWVGLILYQLLLGTVLVVGIRNYFKLKTTHMKIFMAGILAVIYAYIIADYPQQAIIMVPSNFVFFILMSAVVKLPTFETTK
jgi:O-antigen ligase